MVTRHAMDGAWARRRPAGASGLLLLAVGCADPDYDRSTLEALAYGAVLDDLDDDPAVVWHETWIHSWNLPSDPPEGIDAGAWADLRRVAWYDGPLPLPEHTRVEVRIVDQDFDEFVGLSFSRVGIAPGGDFGVLYATQWRTPDGADLRYGLVWKGRRWEVESRELADWGIFR